jgi:hypothetical protein
MTAGIRKELAIYCLAYNLVHAVMLEAARRSEVSPDRISFIDIVRWLLSAAPGEEIARPLINPRRANRHEPRVTKDPQDSYPKMCQPRATLQKAVKMRTIAA